MCSLSAATQGDLLPWTVAQQFQDADFASLSGARIVRIAVHPEMGRAGYGSRAVELLRRWVVAFGAHQALHADNYSRSSLNIVLSEMRRASFGSWVVQLLFGWVRLT